MRIHKNQLGEDSMKEVKFVCRECGESVEYRSRKEKHPIFKLKPVDARKDSTIHNVPFYCKECGSIKSPFKAIHDYVFIYPLFKPTAESNIIDLPDTIEKEPTDYGIILSFGPGYYHPKKRFIRSADIQVGMKVVYDKTVPWEVVWRGQDEKEHLLKVMPYPNVRLIPKENDI